MKHSTVEALMRDVDNALRTDPGRSQDVQASYVFEVSGPTGGTWSILAADGTGEVRQGAVDAPDATIRLEDQTLLNLGSGELDGSEAFMEGLIQVDGDVSKAIFLAQIIGG